MPEERTRPWRNRWAALGRGRMHYVEAGMGTPIVLLHGWPGYWFDYRSVIAGAAALGHAIAPDFLGFGESSPVPTDDPAGADESAYAQDIRGLLAALRVRRAIFVGQDIGSAVAPAVARAAPELVAGLVLLNPTHPLIGDRRYTQEAQREAWYQHFHVLPLAAQLIDGDVDRIRSYLSHFYRQWAGERTITTADLETVVQTYAQAGAFAASLSWYRSRARRRADVSTPDPVTAPTIALWGDRDPMRPLSHRPGFEEAFPNASSRVLPGVGHFVAAEAPEAVLAAIKELSARADQR
jgi:pimeloyl-ACP methyl ester carboxylesterase